MKTVIYYFSGTGNTLAVAKKLAEELGEADIMPMSILAASKNIPEVYKYVGFAAPSYYSHIPPYVRECMTDIVFSKQQKVLLIVTCGGNRGAAIQDMRKQINAANKEVMLEYRFILPGSYILSYGAFPSWYQILTSKLSYRAVHKAANDIMLEKKKKPLDYGLFYSEKKESRLQREIAEFSSLGKAFYTNDKCLLCGACVKLCPVSNISVSNGKICFGNNCNLCMACIQWCPQAALEHPLNSVKRRRYHHPDVNMKELFQDNWQSGK